jgi:hypothetical protein
MELDPAPFVMDGASSKEASSVLCVGSNLSAGSLPVTLPNDSALGQHNTSSISTRSSKVPSKRFSQAVSDEVSPIYLNIKEERCETLRAIVGCCVNLLGFCRGSTMLSRQKKHNSKNESWALLLPPHRIPMTSERFFLYRNVDSRATDSYRRVVVGQWQLSPRRR